MVRWIFGAIYINNFSNSAERMSYFLVSRVFSDVPKKADLGCTIVQNELELSYLKFQFGILVSLFLRILMSIQVQFKEQLIFNLRNSNLRITNSPQMIGRTEKNMVIN